MKTYQEQIANDIERYLSIEIEDHAFEFERGFEYLYSIYNEYMERDEAGVCNPNIGTDNKALMVEQNQGLLNDALAESSEDENRKASEDVGFADYLIRRHLLPSILKETLHDFYRYQLWVKFGDAVATFNADPFLIGDYPETLEFIVANGYNTDYYPEPAELGIADNDAANFNYFVSESEDKSERMHFAVRK